MKTAGCLACEGWDEGHTCHEQRAKKAEAEVEKLRTVLRSLISCGGTSPLIRAMAMNVLEAGSGDAWLRERQERKED